MGYIKPTENWIGETIVSDLSNMINKNGRTKYFEVFRQNRESVFGVWENGKLVGPNMSKIEATQGPAFKDALEDLLWRMETGSNRLTGSKDEPLSKGLKERIDEAKKKKKYNLTGNEKYNLGQ